MKHNQVPFRCQHEIDGIRADNAAGAAEILRRAAAIFLLVDPSEYGDIAQARASIAGLCENLARAQPNMASVFNLAQAVKAAAWLAANPDDAVEYATKAAEAFLRRSAAAGAAAAKHTASLINAGTTLLTHSRSSTVLSAISIASANGIRFKVIVTESRPVMEGRTLAAQLASAGLPVTLIADAAAALVLRDKPDLVLVGADTVTPEAVVNKIGTFMISLAARENLVPVHTVCDTTKFIASTGSGSLHHQEQNPLELWPDAPTNVKVTNQYFEETPLRYFSSVITEEGPLSATEAARQAATNTPL
ncbi:MAG TPA: hypothetical protein VFV34_18715 [Blastocatellia bacterium]|nr:hypothetical protein [Blastocatellia bacterium]